MIADRTGIEKALEEAQRDLTRRRQAGEPWPPEFVALIEKAMSDLRREHRNYHRAALTWWHRAITLQAGPEAIVHALWHHAEGLFVRTRHALKYGN